LVKYEYVIKDKGDIFVMKKVFYWLSTVLQVLFLITAYGIYFFSAKKMGMMRYVVYMNHEWEKLYPIASLQYIAIAVLVILVSFTYIVFVKKKKKRFCSW